MGFRTVSYTPRDRPDRRLDLVRLLRETPLPAEDLHHNLGLYQTRQNLSRVLFLHDLYRRIVEVPGVVMEFGVRWGQTLALFSSFRGIYEPYNYNRRIVGFDTFAGFAAVDARDGAHAAPGDYAVSEDYQQHLSAVLDVHEALSPLDHVRKYELVAGDATQTIGTYLERNPQTVVALAYFDFDVYAPTKACLEAILPRLTRGSVLVFDELNTPEFPGETLAVMETLGLNRLALRRSPLVPLAAYAVIE